MLSTYAEMPQRLFSAMGYGKFRPIIDVTQLKSKEQINEARAQNRRVEIYLDAFLKNKTEFNI